MENVLKNDFGSIHDEFDKGVRKLILNMGQET